MNSGQIESLEREIEATRHALDRILSALQLRLSPRQRAKVAWRVAREGSTESLTAAGRWIRQRPMTAAAIALGIGAGICAGMIWYRRRS
ncbi:MAG TPA: DUF3618 domain-containing protein [Steroidobacteraceae bacterium]|nr:DUF3618 domain-containing protein [Steroidobacteraceae bacterium]